MANRQYKCEAELKHWQKEFFKILLPASKVMAVNRLCEFAAEMRAHWPDTRPPGSPPTPIATSNARKAAAYPAPVSTPSPEQQDHVHVTFLEVRDGGAKVDFAGALEGAGFAASPQSAYPVQPSLPVQPQTPTTDPSVVLVNVYAMCPNPRLLAGQLPDGSVVAVWKGPRHWRLPCKVLCRKDAGSPNYNPV